MIRRFSFLATGVWIAITTITVLPWALFGRRVKPLSVAAIVANLSMVFDVRDVAFSVVVSLFAVVGVAAFCVAWWVNSSRLIQVGMLLTVGLFGFRAAYSGISFGWADQEVWLSVSWMIAAGGAFLLERRAPRTWEPEVYGGNR